MWFPFFLIEFFLFSVNGLDNGLASTPPMGWMTWGRYRCKTDCVKEPNECLSERLMLDVTDKIVSDGYADVGYQYIVIDDCWMQRDRDQYGRLQPDWERFPRGIKYISDHVHSVGLKFGIYENYGEFTCEHYAGSKGHVKMDVELFASWEVDYLKLDGCFTRSDELDFGYPEFSRELNKTGRPIVFSCSWPYYQEHIFKIAPNYEQIKKHCNLWRNYHDIQPSWEVIKLIINYYGVNHEIMSSLAGPGHWNDPDMLMIGNGGLNEGQSRVQMAVWSILAAPLIMSNDLGNIPQEMRRILQNVDVIAVDQDPLGRQGGLFKTLQGLKVWRREVIPVLGNIWYSYAFAFVNLNSKAMKTITLDLIKLELENPYGYLITDLFANKELRNLTDNGYINVTVKPMDVLFYKFQVLLV